MINNKIKITEETGYAVTHVKPAGEIYVSPAGCTERIYLFTAAYTPEMKTASGGGLQEEQEFIDIEEVPYEEALQQISNGTIKDAKTIVLLYHLRIQGIM